MSMERNQEHVTLDRVTAELDQVHVELDPVPVVVDDQMLPKMFCNVH